MGDSVKIGNGVIAPKAEWVARRVERVDELVERRWAMRREAA